MSVLTNAVIKDTSDQRSDQISELSHLITHDIQSFNNVNISENYEKSRLTLETHYSGCASRLIT